eukprot:8105783-Ditylum_brightwellii.AAC.1
MVADCPIIWNSKLQTIISESNMERKYISLFAAWNKLLPLKNFFERITVSLGIIKKQLSIYITIWEDNKSALSLPIWSFPK